MVKVTYIQHCGNDLTAVNSARISLNDESKELNDKDKKLIQYLAKNKHMSPFEHNLLTVLIECPLYIRSQIQRHRTFSYNEISRRYTSENIEFFIPKTIRHQSKSNRQASDVKFNKLDYNHTTQMIRYAHHIAEDYYNKLLELGVSREQARGVLPQNLMTKFYMSGNLRNWVSFIQLRDSNHAQEEVREIAVEIKQILLDKFEVSSKSLLENL